MKQVSKEQAIKIYESGLWADWSDSQKVEFQLFQNRLCMPFNEFHAAITRVLKRPVYTHEFGLNRDGLQKEFLGEVDAPTFEDIIEMIPKHLKTIVINIDDEK